MPTFLWIELLWGNRCCWFSIWFFSWNFLGKFGGNFNDFKFHAFSCRIMEIWGVKIWIDEPWSFEFFLDGFVLAGKSEAFEKLETRCLFMDNFCSI
jgi:hypothetical protein